jgi:DNA-binding NarL/FixJ family response regulator
MTTENPPIRVLIADDHAVVREGIRQVLNQEEFDIVGEAADGQAAVDLAVSQKPDVVILDLSMPILSGLEAAERIHESTPDARILVLSIHDHEEYVLRSVRAGAVGYLRKDSSPAELRSAVRAVHDGGSFFSAPAARSLSAALRAGGDQHSPRDRLAALTSREREVLAEIASGRTNREIAAHFGISVRTVESHREALMKKLGVRGAASLTRFAIDAGMVRSSTES